MPTPVTVYKGNKSVRNVYPSELSSWLNDGWTTKQTTEFQPETQEKESVDLKTLSWSKLKEKATELGLEKPDGVSWADFIPDIEKAIKEQSN